MPNYAVVQNDEIINVIVAENLAIAEQVTECECFEVEIEPGNPSIGWKRVDEEWIDPNIPVEEKPKPITK